jgi:hypothetical protein
MAAAGISSRSKTRTSSRKQILAVKLILTTNVVVINPAKFDTKMIRINVIQRGFRANLSGRSIESAR